MSATVTIRQGKLEGLEQGGLAVFKGIPFAEPPIGARRWLPPEKPASWTGVRDARNYGSAGPQLRGPGGVLAAMIIEEPQSEDCLYLNVWTPKLDGKRRPVMVWIHGGAFRIGSGSQAIYDGANLAQRGDVVVVTINYRIGAFGFLRLTDLTAGKVPATGNEGMLDQIAALEWVRDNIAEFGGDPGNVTIFGESAGGMSVGTLLAMPAARGLFHKAIPQSGACHTGSPADRANRTAEKIISRLGVSGADADAIRKLPVDGLLRSTMLADGVTEDPELGMAYQPCIEGELVPRVAIESVAAGSAAGVPILVGSTLEEWKLFAVMDPGALKLDKTRLSARFGRRLTPQIAEPLIASYEKARASRGEPATPPEIFSAIETDRIFRMPALKLAETQARHESRVFNYLFTWKSPAMHGALGSCHALELGFVFGTNDRPGMPQFAGVGPAADRLATSMQDAWLSFAKSGNPGWEPYTAARRTTMIFGETSKAENAPRDEERQAWGAVPEKVLGSL